MNQEKLNAAIGAYITKKAANAAYYDDNRSERKARLEYYQSFDKNRLLAMTEEDFIEYIGKLWSMVIWGSKKYIAEKLMNDNGFDHIKKQLAELLFGSADIKKRWDAFLKNVKGLGPATVSELLTYINPQEYVIFNKTTIQCFTYLDIPGMPKYNYQYTGKKYAEVCGIAKQIASALSSAGAGDSDLLTLNYFMWDELLPLSERAAHEAQPAASPAPATPATETESRSLHDEIKEKLVIIGGLLGFECRSEVRIAPGSIVDVVWEARIGNMGRAIYVFEVQCHGSIESAVLNLAKALNNAAVQAVVAVADEAQLDKFIRESQGVIAEKDLRTWNSDDVLSVHDALVRAHESINKLALVPEGF